MSRAATIATILLTLLTGCSRTPAEKHEVRVYCGIDEPYASEVFKQFEQQTGIHVIAQYDAEATRSVGVYEKLQSEAGHPQADVWWGNDPLSSVRLANSGILDAYASPSAEQIAPQFKDPDHRWAGIGLRARVLVVAEPGPGFEITGLHDLLDPRLKGKIALARPTTGSITAQMAALWIVWGPEKTRAFLKGLRDNSADLLGGNSLVADGVGRGDYILGLTDSDDAANTLTNGGKLKMVLPNQNVEGTVAIPTTVGLVKGGPNEADAKKLVDFLLSKPCEDKLLAMKFVRWSTRVGATNELKAMQFDYRQAAKIEPDVVRESNAILDGRQP